MTENILFVCTENAARSQMAEAFLKRLAPKNFVAKSAGTKPSSQINPVAVKVMKEIGIDMSQNHPKPLLPHMIRDSVKTINMGCMDKESCPSLNALDWQIKDPKGKPIEDVRKIRDEIEFKVKKLVIQLENEIS